MKIVPILLFAPAMAVLAATVSAPAQNPPEPAPPVVANDGAPQFTVAQLAERVKPSLVTVAHYGRDGMIAGSGSGFVVAEDGLIATCLHVIGEGRRVSITFADGRKFEATAVQGFDRKTDLAVLRIDAAGLAALPLGDPLTLAQGERVVAMGNPEGLEFSVVEGVLSAMRDFDSGPMLQLAIPVERGNSGGPVLDLAGRVHGLMSIKSTVTDNLGFATPSSALRALLEQPNSVPMERWLTIGALDSDRWKPVMGARWRQRAGRILVDESGDGFGGRSLCLWQAEPESDTYEVAVSVKLDDESGAAGLVFAADGENRHYGFYPSAGNLRLTRFEGPTVYEWTILDQVPSEAYRPGEWNHLRIRVSPELIVGWVNGRKVIERADGVLRGGRAGLAKFRNTRAEFKDFAVGENLAVPGGADARTAERMRIGIASMPATAEPFDDLAESFATNPELARQLLEARAEELIEAASAVRNLARQIHTEAIQRDLTVTVDAAEAAFARQLARFHPPAGEPAGPGNEVETEDDAPVDGPDLATISLLVARLDNPELDIQAYVSEIDALAAEFRRERGTEAATDPLDALTEFLFRGNGFHGSRSDYYNRSNSYLNEVIDDREGIPLSLSVLFMEVARRAGIDGVLGLGLPGHFIVKAHEDDGTHCYIDVFDGGRRLPEEEADLIVRSNGPSLGSANNYPPASPREIAVRMLTNLKAIAIEEEAWQRARSYADLLIALEPDNGSERLSRALIAIQSGRPASAREDFEWILEHSPEGIDLDRIRQFLEFNLE